MKKHKVKIGFLLILIIGFLLPQNLKIPVVNAGKSDYHPKSFWYYPWGKSVTHKGVDIFAKSGTMVTSATKGIVLYTGKIKYGGNFIIILGPKWRLHYYAHLNEIRTKSFHFVNQKSIIATVGISGNAKEKEPHLHYSITTIIPYPWKIDFGKQGWKKMFYLNPIPYFNLGSI